eukprot:scaffold133363_cov26-Tisochrysis_lutea.AAC.3
MEASTALEYRSPSIVAGTPTTRVFAPRFAKCSARTAVSELVTGPPMRTSPSSPSLAQVASA